jgi:hypothetical protein
LAAIDLAMLTMETGGEDRYDEYIPIGLLHFSHWLPCPLVLDRNAIVRVFDNAIGGVGALGTVSLGHNPQVQG